MSIRTSSDLKLRAAPGAAIPKGLNILRHDMIERGEGRHILKMSTNLFKRLIQ
jgi:hypothetical protein